MNHTSSRRPRPGALQGQRAVVWGACGFIGRHLVRRLLADGALVTVLTGPMRRQPQPDWGHAVSWFTTDKANPSPEILRAAVRSADVVYNLAGPSGAVRSNRDPLTDLDLTCRPQLLFLKACAEQERSPHVIFASTRLVYLPAGRTPVTEDSAVEPRSMYAAHKLCIEHYHRLFAATGRVTFSILRASPIFGFDPMVRVRGHGIINMFIRDSVRGEAITLFGDGSQIRDFMYVEDFVNALAAASVAPAARNAVLNVGSGERIRLREAAEIVRAMVGGPAIRYQAWPAEYASVESGDYVVDVSKAQRVLRVSLRCTFRRAVALTLAAVSSELAQSPGVADVTNSMVPAAVIR